MFNQVKILRVLQLISLLKKQPPKTIKSLAGFLENTERTVYRYLDLIRELGFDLQKDDQNRFLIVGDIDTVENNFTPEEASLLNDLLLSSGNKSALKDSLLRKIYIKSELSIQGNNLVNAHLGKLIEKLSFAIEHNRQVILKNYHSASTQSISDRLIEPIKFTDNYTSLCAFEIETKENKYFKLERMTEAIVTEKTYKHKNLHQFINLDPFGYAPTNNPPVDIELILNLRAYILIKEEYPFVMTFIKPESRDKYRLKIKANDPKPVLRFIMGLLDDIIIVGSIEFEEYILEYVNKLFLFREDD